jgi:hypothetical protein
VLDCSLLEVLLVVWLEEPEPDEALSCRSIEFLGSVDEDDVLLLGFHQILDHYPDVH